MQVKILKDEMYPVYYIHDSYGVEVDIPDEIIEDALVAKDLFLNAQNRLENYYKQAVIDVRKRDE